MQSSLHYYDDTDDVEAVNEGGWGDLTYRQFMDRVNDMLADVIGMDAEDLEAAWMAYWECGNSPRQACFYALTEAFDWPTDEARALGFAEDF